MNMKKWMPAAVLAAALGFAGAVSAADYVTLVYEGSQEKVRGLNLDTLQVCSLKEQAASLFSVSPKKFDLWQGAKKLDEGKTLTENRVPNMAKVVMKPVGSSFQC